MVEGNMGILEPNANRDLWEYKIPNFEGTIPTIMWPAIQPNNFVIKTRVIEMIQNVVQFGGLPSDDPNLYTTNFLEICDT